MLPSTFSFYQKDKNQNKIICDGRPTSTDTFHPHLVLSLSHMCKISFVICVIYTSNLLYLYTAIRIYIRFPWRKVCFSCFAFPQFCIIRGRRLEEITSFYRVFDHFWINQMAAPPARARADYDFLIKLLLIGDSGTHSAFVSFFIFHLNPTCTVYLNVHFVWLYFWLFGNVGKICVIFWC